MGLSKWVRHCPRTVKPKMSGFLWIQRPIHKAHPRNPKIKTKQKHSFRAKLYPEVCLFFQLYQLHLSGTLPLQKLYTTAPATTAALHSTKGIFPAKYLKSKYWCYDLPSTISNQCFHWRQEKFHKQQMKPIKKHELYEPERDSLCISKVAAEE